LTWFWSRAQPSPHFFSTEFFDCGLTFQIVAAKWQGAVFDFPFCQSVHKDYDKHAFGEGFIAEAISGIPPACS